MARRKQHKDVEFHVHDTVLDTWAEAAALALARAVSTGRERIDILVYSEAGARWLGGDDAVEQYREDPEASVFERIDIRANSEGRIP